MKWIGVVAVVLAALAGVAVGYSLHEPETTVIREVQTTTVESGPCASNNPYLRALEDC